MLFETNSDKCPKCKGSLTLLSHRRRFEKSAQTYEFEFRCDSCQREYQFIDGKLEDLKKKRDLVGEHVAVRKVEIITIRNRRCSHCGGPLDDFLTCEWCSERYVIENGELIPRIEELLKRKPQMSEFYAQQ